MRRFLVAAVMGVMMAATSAFAAEQDAARRALEGEAAG